MSIAQALVAWAARHQRQTVTMPGKSVPEAPMSGRRVVLAGDTDAWRLSSVRWGGVRRRQPDHTFQMVFNPADPHLVHQHRQRVRGVRWCSVHVIIVTVTNVLLAMRADNDGEAVSWR
jgi:KUP system potassium uptake protein